MSTYSNLNACSASNVENLSTLRVNIAGPAGWKAGRRRRRLTYSLHIYSGFVYSQLLNHLNVFQRFHCPPRAVISPCRKASSLEKMIMLGGCYVAKNIKAYSGNLQITVVFIGVA